MFNKFIPKIILGYILALISMIGLSIVTTDYFKQRIAYQLAQVFSSSVIAGDNRRMMVELPRGAENDFACVKWESQSQGSSFFIPGNISGINPIVLKAAVVPVFFDEAKTIPAGQFEFYYNRWGAVFWALLAWLAIVIFSIPILYREKNRFVREYNTSVQLRISESFSVLAAQVAHDIRSPLAALSAAAKGLELLPPEQRSLIEGSAHRMQGIADDLLQRYRAPEVAVKAKVETCALAGLIDQILAEKRLQHKDKANVKIKFTDTAAGAKAAVHVKELQRIISNLVNNSVEAFTGPGSVAVKLAAVDGKVLIEIHDDGKGIPPEILARLGQKGETHGKTGGTGLGLYHAHISVESWGGSLKINSEPGKGTTVSIILPAAARPAAGLQAALLDDDPLVHMNWRLAAKAAGAELKSFKTPQEFSAAAETLPRDLPLYIDSELGNDIKGEDIAKDLREKGFTDITMSTGHGLEKFTHLPWLKVTGKEPPWA